MPIITNFLVISMVILTIFVKMVPAPDGIDESIKINHYVGVFLNKLILFLLVVSSVDIDFAIHVPSYRPLLVTTANLNKFKELYQTEIQEFCTKQKTPTSDMPAKALFYLKNSFDDFSRTNWFLEIGSNVYANFLILRKETASKGPLDQLYTADNLKNFKEVTITELITIYESATFCSLPNNIQDKIVFGQLNFVHDIENSIQITKGKGQISVEELIQNFKNSKESQDAGVPLDIYIQFKENWEFYDFTEVIFNQYNSTFNKTVLEDIGTGGEISYKDNGVTKTMGMFDAFLYFFKESLDDNYYMTLHMDTKELDNSQKTFYYNQMLRGMKKIYDLYSVQHGKPKSNSGTDFVQKMVNVAEEIKQKLNITKEMTDITGQINEASKTNDGIKLMNHRYTSCYRYNRCGLPSKVYFKDIIQYLIFQIAVPVIDDKEDAHIVPAITNSD